MCIDIYIIRHVLKIDNYSYTVYYDVNHRKVLLRLFIRQLELKQHLHMKRNGNNKQDKLYRVFVPRG